MGKFFVAILRVLAASALLVGAAAAQQSYPNRVVRIISPNPPGGSTTFYGRLIAQKLADALGQQVILENRGGGNGLIGGDAVAKSVPDGYTLEQVSSTHLITPLLMSAPYDPVKDFTQIGTYVRNETVLVVYPGLPTKTLQDFLALAKAKPGDLNYGSSGGGSPLHLSGVLFEEVAGVQLQHVPYKGGGPAVTDLIGGQVQASFQTPVAVISHIKSGRLRALGITGEKRSASIPQVPTFIEAGLPGFTALSGHQGLIAPAGTPIPIVNRISAEIAKIVTQPDFIQKLAEQGAEPFFTTPEQYAAMVRSETARFIKIIKDANIKID